MRLLTGILAAMLLLQTNAGAQDDAACNSNYDALSPEELNSPMEFIYCFVGGNSHDPPVHAVGTITPDTPKKFAEYIAERGDLQGGIQFSSPGGNLSAALELGELIRGKRTNTSLGAICANACVYAFLGGVTRSAIHFAFIDWDQNLVDNSDLPAENRIGIQQFSQHGSVSNSQDKIYSAAERSADQVLMSLLLEYTIRMGASPDLVKTASRVPWQSMHWFTARDLSEWNIDNTVRRYKELVLKPFGKTGSYVETENITDNERNALRIFCKKLTPGPVFTFIFDLHSDSDESLNTFRIRTKSLLQSIFQADLEYTLENGKEKKSRVRLEEFHGVEQENDKIRIFLVARPLDITHAEAEQLKLVQLVDNGYKLSRVATSYMEYFTHKIRGDRRLIRLAMRNCTNGLK